MLDRSLEARHKFVSSTKSHRKTLSLTIHRRRRFDSRNTLLIYSPIMPVTAFLDIAVIKAHAASVKLRKKMTNSATMVICISVIGKLVTPSINSTVNAMHIQAAGMCNLGAEPFSSRVGGCSRRSRSSRPRAPGASARELSGDCTRFVQLVHLLPVLRWLWVVSAT